MSSYFDLKENGSYTPSVSGLFISKKFDETSDSKSRRVKFHEFFHLWQCFFTPYGCMKANFDNTFYANIVNEWLKAHKKLNKFYLPFHEMFDKPEMTIDSFYAFMEGVTSKSMLRIIDVLERKVLLNSTEDCVIFKNIHKVVPTIIVDENEYELNGIDIFESFAKYQEAYYAYFYENMSFEEVLNPKILPKEYFVALEYFLQELGGERIYEFPVVCEISLYASDIGKRSQEDWQIVHPGWRFVKIINVLKNNKNINLPKEIKGNFNDYIDEVLNRCGFQSRKEAWNRAELMINDIHFKYLREKLIRAIEFKKNNPWILAFPFITSGIEHDGLMSFAPNYYNYMDTTDYVINKENQYEHMIEIDEQIHMQALANQIMGTLSKYCVDRHMLNCGYKYYNIKACNYFLEGKCSGALDPENGLITKEEDDLHYCDFKIFLEANLHIDIHNLSIGDLLSQKKC